MKALIVLVACALATPALASTYRYDLSMPYTAGSIDNAGWIMTSCDSCSLNSKNILGWSMSQTNPAMTGFDGAPFTASTVPGASVLVRGDEFVASPTGLTFDFGAGTYADVLFSSQGHSVHFTNVSDSPFQAGGTLEDCSARLALCVGSSYSGREKLGGRSGSSPTSAPEMSAGGALASLTLLAAVVAVQRARPRRRRVLVRASRRD